MNKELPSIVSKIFADPDPVIWSGFWLICLNTLLQSKNMFVTWEKLILQIKDNHKTNNQLSLNKYVKWELKAFVAITIKNFKLSKNEEEFISKTQSYLKLKKLELDQESIKKIFGDLEQC